MECSISSSKSSKNTSKGRRGEFIAAGFLLSRGWRILERNPHFLGGELDLVARDSQGILVFVEVKSSWSYRGGRPAAQVHIKKQFRVWRAARAWLARTRTSPDQLMRFDVVCIRFRNGIPDVELICDAFVGPSSGY